jgi:hypothetical protein
MRCLLMPNRTAPPSPPHTSPPPALQLGLGDDQQASGYEAALDPWLAQLWTALARHFPPPPGRSEPAPDDAATELLPKFRVTWLGGEEAAGAAAAAAAMAQAAAQRDGAVTPDSRAHWEAVHAASLFDAAEAAASGLPLPQEEEEEQQQASSRGGAGPATSAACDGAGGSCRYGPRRPYWARLAANRRITAASHFQDVRLVELELGPSSISFQPGDVLALVPRQPMHAVHALLQRCGWDAEAWVRVEPAARGEPGGQGGGGCGAVVRLGALVAGALDINGASPRRSFFQARLGVGFGAGGTCPCWC